MFISPVREGMIGFFNVVGRLEPGATLAQARAEIDGIRARIAHEHPNPYRFEDQRKLRRQLRSATNSVAGDADTKEA